MMKDKGDERARQGVEKGAKCKAHSRLGCVVRIIAT